MTDLEKTENNNLSFPFMHIISAIDDLTKRAIPYQQTLLYAENLLPEYIECAYKTKLLIAKTYSIAHNTASLCGELDNAFSLKLASYNVDFFLASSVEKIKSLYDNRNIDIAVDCSAECKKVILDIRRTSLILFNLISNAVIHSGVKDKKISIFARIENQNFILSVKDNGKGVPKSQHKHLFSAYQDKLTAVKLKETSGGLFTSGTGLAVSLKAATEMNGSLSFIPTNNGAKFELIIPQDKKPLSVGEAIDYSPSEYEIETYLADSLLMYLLEDEENK